MLDALATTLADRRTALTRRQGEESAAKRSLATAEESLSELNEARDRAKAAHQVLQVAAEKLRERMKSTLEDVATRALRFVFQRDYRVEFKVEVKHGQVKAEPWVYEGGVGARALDGHGGGLSDVLAFVLRTAVLRSMPGRKILLADEPFKFLNSPDAMSQMLELVTQLGKTMQLVIVSSREDLTDGEGAKVFRMDKGPDGAVVEEV